MTESSKKAKKLEIACLSPVPCKNLVTSNLMNSAQACSTDSSRKNNIINHGVSLGDGSGVAVCFKCFGSAWLGRNTSYVLLFELQWREPSR